MSAPKYQLKQVTVAILKCASFHSLCCLMNRKGKFGNKQCLYRNNKMFCGIKSCNTSSNAAVWQYSDGTHNGGVACKGYEKIAIFDQYHDLSLKRYKIGT